MSSALQLYVYDPLERAGSTAVQQFSVIILAGGTAALVSAPWATALWTALFAGIISLLTSAVSFTVPALPLHLDLLLRVLKTGVQSLVGTLVASQVTDVVHANWKGALAVAFPVMIAALAKGAAAIALPWSEGASLVPELAGSETGGGTASLLTLDIPEPPISSPAPHVPEHARPEAPELGHNPG